MNPGILILLAAGVFFMMQKQSITTGSPAPGLITTDQKRRSINSWWEISTSPNDQASDGGRFEDIINNISPGEIDSIYSYIFTYVVNGTRPPVGSSLYNAIQIISHQYEIFT